MPQHLTAGVNALKAAYLSISIKDFAEEVKRFRENKEKMITIIFGAPGMGKTALNTFFLQQVYEEKGTELLEFTQEKIREINQMRKKPLTMPDKAPIFSNYKVNLHVGYKKYYQPYFMNAFLMGLENGNLPTIYMPPGSKVFLNEAQKYYDSRKQIPDWVSRFYETHRHNHYDLYIDVQRAKLIDLNIKALCKRFIELQRTENITNWAGDIERTIFHCREFDSWGDAEQYLSTGAQMYRTVEYVNEGNIFESYDSYGCAEDFVPPQGKDYNYLPFLTKREIEGLPEKQKVYYGSNEPKEYRGEKKKGSEGAAA